MDDRRVQSLVQQELRSGPLAVLVRQLQGRLQGGTVNVTGGGSTTVAHGLGRVPVSIQLQTHFDGGTPVIDWDVQNVDEVSFDAVNPSATTSDAYWMAF